MVGTDDLIHVKIPNSIIIGIIFGFDTVLFSLSRLIFIDSLTCLLTVCLYSSFSFLTCSHAWFRISSYRVCLSSSFSFLTRRYCSSNRVCICSSFSFLTRSHAWSRMSSNSMSLPFIFIFDSLECLLLHIS